MGSGVATLCIPASRGIYGSGRSMSPWPSARALLTSASEVSSTDWAKSPRRWSSSASGTFTAGGGTTAATWRLKYWLDYQVKHPEYVPDFYPQIRRAGVSETGEGNRSFVGQLQVGCNIRIMGIRLDLCSMQVTIDEDSFFVFSTNRASPTAVANGNHLKG